MVDGVRLKKWGEGIGFTALGIYLVACFVSALTKVESMHGLTLGAGLLAGVAFVVGGLGVVQSAQVAFKGRFGGEMVVRGTSAQIIGVGFVLSGAAVAVGIVLHALTAADPQRLLMSAASFVFTGAGMVILGGLVPTYVKTSRAHGGLPLALFTTVTFGGFGLAVTAMGLLGIFMTFRG